MILAGRALSDKRKMGTIMAVTVACILTGLMYDDYFLTFEGIKSVGSALLIFAATLNGCLRFRMDGFSHSIIFRLRLR